ncbi:MAG: nitrate reductase associated protein [Myxococcales bacterium]
MYLRFAFEGDVHETLQTIPLAVRRKLDLSGLKLSLAGWTALSRAERLAVCHLPADSPQDIEVYREALRGFAERAGHPVTPLESGPADPASWGTAQVPATIAGRVDAREWSGLPDEARYVLLKLSDPKRDPTKFNLALGELRQT